MNRPQCFNASIHNLRLATASFVLLAILSLSSISHAQWLQVGNVPVPTSTRPCISVYAPDGLVMSGGPVGGPPVMYRSSNGGATWNAVPIPPTSSTQILNVWAKSYDEFFAGDMGDGSYGRAFRTTNGGTTWQEILAGPGPSASINGIVFSKMNSQVGVVLCSREGTATVITGVTTDGGNTWSVRSDGPVTDGTSINSLFCIDEQFFGFGSADASRRVWITTNGGNSWNERVTSFTAGQFLAGLSFKHDGLIGIASISGQLPTISRTTDGGVTWSAGTIASGPGGFSRVRWIVGTNHVYVSGASGSPGCIARSVDGGATWELMTTNVPGVWHLEYFKDGSGMIHMYSISGNGSVMRYRYTPTGVEPVSNAVPTEFRLEQNYPNPFNPSTRIPFAVRSSGFVSLKVYDILGREVRTLVNDNLQPGSYEVMFNADGLTSGVYFSRMTAPGFTSTKKMILTR
jgi:photosystem II stability/assembly factor-like uncharacterized protein